MSFKNLHVVSLPGKYLVKKRLAKQEEITDSFQNNGKECILALGCIIVTNG